ncbi:MAG TPA: arylsulfotransferase family protein [Alphaproteobacteria bacterium]|nr:arylsulfotransferase family protein [Alphaproteobacteria bacterium]
MRRSQLFAIIYLIIIVSLSYGYAIGHFHWWPYDTFQKIEDIITDAQKGETTLVENIKSDLNIEPLRFTQKIYLGQDKLAKASDIVMKADHVGFNSRRALPKYRSNMERGAWLIYGAFDFNETLYGVILINHIGEIIKAWPLSQENMPWSMEDDNFLPGQGLKLLADGSFLTILGGGETVGALIRTSWCGNNIYSVGEHVHHTIASDGQGKLWTLDNQRITALSEVDGKVLESFDTFEIMKANPDLYIFEIRSDIGHKGWFRGGRSEYDEDPFHPNSIDPLTEELAQFYPQFQEGDLLISMRNINLVFVLRPATKKVLWYRQGLTSRQHSARWNNQGTITVFNNRPDFDRSDITELSLADHSARALVSGRDYGIYSHRRGDHRYLDDGSVLIVSANQGRLLHILPDGSVGFDFFNVYNDNKVLRIQNAEYVTDEEVERFNRSCE